VSHRCIDESQLDRLLELAEDHPDRREANSCTQCRTLLIQYAAFKAANIPDGARYEEAEPVLARFKESLLSTTAHEAKLAPSKPFSIRSFFHGTRARFAWGAVATAVIVFIAVITWAPRSEREITLRGESPNQEPRIALPELQVNDSGTIRLYWPSVREADSYKITVYNIDFVQVFSKTTADTEYILNINDLTGEVKADDMLQWRIEPLRGGEVLEQSHLGVIQLR
jgi:hypothetical protein